MYMFVDVVAIAVNHSVHHALANSHPDLMQIVLVKTFLFTGAKNSRFSYINAFEGGIEIPV